MLTYPNRIQLNKTVEEQRFHITPWKQAIHDFYYRLILFHIQAQDSTVGPVVLDVVSTIQAHIMNASYSVSLTKPLLTKNIRKFYNAKWLAPEILNDNLKDIIG